ncbi:MAG: MFS transporter [Erythrobacter sp.]
MTAAKRSLFPAHFVLSYGTANAGASIAYVPLLVLILPLKAEIISPDNKLQLLSLALLIGAIAASVSNIIAGWISDRMFARIGSRVPQIAIGLVAILLSYAVFARANSAIGLIGAVVFFQFCLNSLFSPLGTLLADKVPHHAKGRMSAVLNLGFPIGTLAIAFMSLSLFDTENARLLALGTIVFACIVPLIFSARSLPDLTVPAPPAKSAPDAISDNDVVGVAISPASGDPMSRRSDLALAWFARFAVQLSGAVIFGYILYFLQDVLSQSSSIGPATADQALAQLTVTATPIAIIMGLWAGYISDRLNARKAFMMIAALAVALSLMMMIHWPSWPSIYVAYVVFSAGLTAYLTIDAAAVTQLIEQSTDKARTLGVMNLTNTLPAIMAPSLALILNSSAMSQSVLIPLLQCAAVLALVGAFAVGRMRLVR